jgi:hypothetical protein
MGGRAEHPWLHGGHLERQNSQDDLACNDTQEIAKSFWSYFYGGMS